MTGVQTCALPISAPLKKTLALAALNALGRACFDKICADYDVKFGADPFDELRIERGSFSVVVGALVSRAP